MDAQNVTVPNNPFSRFNAYWKTHRLTPIIVFFFLVYIVATMKLVAMRDLGDNLFFGAYSILVSFYILSRFALAHFYRPKEVLAVEGYEPTVSFAVPAKNEGDNIYETIMRIADSDYPKHKFDVIAINDGSTDATLSEMQRAKRDAKELGVEVAVVDWTVNKGKREGMAECVRLSQKEIIFFIDSDSFVARDAVREVVKYFSIENIGAVAGHAYVANSEVNLLTKMQDVRYYVAFKAFKASEALFGSVTCCSGCCAAYRRSYLMQFLEAWANQSFLGVKCTYGDDRSLTNFMLYCGYDTVFAPEVIAHTFVPENFKQYARQQLRWKKSWVRESLLASIFIWRRNPIMSLSFYLGMILPLIAPLVMLRAIIWYPIVTSRLPLYYIFGLMMMAIVYGLYYYIHTNDKKWFYGVAFVTLFNLALIWQLPYAMLTIRDSRWGTR